MWELDHKEDRALKNWCFWNVVLEKTLEGPLETLKEIKPVNPKGNQPLIFTGRTVAEVEALTLWPPDVNCWLTGKYPDAGKDWGKQEKGMREGEMVGWTWVWANSGRRWRTGKPVVLQSMGSQSVRYDLATQQQSLCYSRKLCPLPVLSIFVFRSCPTLWNPMDCSSPGSTVLCVILDSIIIELGNHANQVTSQLALLQNGPMWVISNKFKG